MGERTAREIVSELLGLAEMGSAQELRERVWSLAYELGVLGKTKDNDNMELSFESSNGH